MKALYLAAPLFSCAEQQFNLMLTRKLAPYYKVFLPQQDGKLLVDLLGSGIDKAEAVAQIFRTDLEAVDNCDVLLVVLDGRSVDEGAAFELGYAYARGKLCIALQTDPRRLLPFGNNPMLEASIAHIFCSTITLVTWARTGKFQEET